MNPAGFTEGSDLRVVPGVPSWPSEPFAAEPRRRAGDRSSPDPGDSRAEGTVEVERGARDVPVPAVVEVDRVHELAVDVELKLPPLFVAVLLVPDVFIAVEIIRFVR